MSEAHGAVTHPPLSSAALSGVEFRMSELTRVFALAVVFVAGWYLCLPETDLVELPLWATKLAIGPNILIHEAVFAGYLLLGGGIHVSGFVRRERPLTLAVSILLVLLAIWCGMSSLLAPEPAHDVGRSARLILLATMLLGVTLWAAANPLFVLRAFLLGLAAGAAVNLAFTFANPVILVGNLPRLLGQNAPGPPMGIAVGLAAWLILVSRQRSDAILALVVAIICGVGALISYSKTGMIAGTLGLVSLAIVAVRVSTTRRGRVLVLAAVTLVAAGSTYFSGEIGSAITGDLGAMVREKLESGTSESQSVQERLGYFLGVAEIIAEHPIGVGYSGFRDAMMDTEVYRAGLAADETFNTPDQANPHSLFLYYASAGGVIGGLLALVIFAFAARALFGGIGLYGAAGFLAAASSTLAFFVLATSIPYLYNSGVMLIPIAISAGIRSHLKPAGSVSPRARRGGR